MQISTFMNLCMYVYMYALKQLYVFVFMGVWLCVELRACEQVQLYKYSRWCLWLVMYE